MTSDHMADELRRTVKPCCGSEIGHLPSCPTRNQDAPEAEREKWQAIDLPTLPAGLPHVQGRCPACGLAALFLGDGGYVTCGNLNCPDPCAATNLLEQSASRRDPLAKCGTCGHTREEHDPYPALRREFKETE